MRKRIGAMILTAVVALCLLPGGARAAGTVQVNTEQQLRDALTGSADVIVLTGNIVVTSEVAIARAVTIRGNGYTIQVPIPGVLDSGLVKSGASTFRVFNISGSGVVIEDLTIKGGDEEGGGMNLEASAKVTLNRVAITNSGGSYSYGGGIYINSGAVLHIKNSVINRNSGGAGGGFYSYGVLIIENTSFSENRNTSGGGGAGENNGKLYMNNCTFANNITAGDGGAINNYISNVTIVMNSSFTGNVCYTGGDLGGAIRNGNTSGVANCLFAYNYGKTGSQDTYRLNDFRESSVSQNRMVNSVFHAVPVNAGTGNTPNKQYGGNANGSDNTLFSGGMQMIVTNATGVQQGTGTVYQPLAYTAPGQFTAVVPLKTGATLGAAGDIPKPVRTIFAPDSSNTSNSYFAYFNETTQKWVSWTSGGWTGTQQPTAAQLEKEVTTDPYGNPKTDLGGTSEEKAKLYTVQLLQTGGWSSMGAVQGATLYGDSYEQGKPITVMATPNANYRFDHWMVKIGSGAEQTSTANPYTQTMGTENITLYPVFATSSGATGTTVHLTLTTNSIQLGSGTQALSAGAALSDLASGNSVPSKSITLYALDASGKVLFSKTQPTSSYGIASFSNVWTPTSAGVYQSTPASPATPPTRRPRLVKT